MAKTNDTFWKVLKMAVAIGVIIASIAIAYGSLNHQVKTNSVNVEKNDREIKVLKEMAIEQKFDISHIKKSVDKILEKVENE